MRAALIKVRAALAGRCVAADEIDRAEIVLAEVLNNIVEHAYAAAAAGEIALRVDCAPGSLRFEVADDGGPMPGGRLPAALRSAPAALPMGGMLPEGGFGWPMIRALSDVLDYCRAEGRNRLSFTLISQQRWRDS